MQVTSSGGSGLHKLRSGPPATTPTREAGMGDDYTVVVTDRLSGKVTRRGFSTLEQAERVANVWHQRSCFRVKIEVTRPSEPRIEDDPLAPSDRMLQLIADLRAVDASPSRRKIDWVEVDAVIAGVMIVIASVVAIIFVNPVAWDALVKFASRPFIVGNAVGLAVTAAGIAAVRHLHNRSH